MSVKKINALHSLWGAFLTCLNILIIIILKYVILWYYKKCPYKKTNILE